MNAGGRPLSLRVLRGAFGLGDERADPRNRLFERVQVLIAGIPENGWIGIVVVVPKHIAMLPMASSM